MKIKEIWKPVPGYPSYLASNLGRVKSPTRILKTANRVNNSGYQHATLWHHKKDKTVAVHWCVLSAFLPADNKKLWVNHKDGDKNNNRLENLEWLTPGQNTKHAFDTGLNYPYNRSGTNNPRSILSKDDGEALVFLRDTGQFTFAHLGHLFGLTGNGAYSAYRRLKNSLIDEV